MLIVLVQSIILYMPGPLLTKIVDQTGWTYGQAGQLNSAIYLTMALSAVFGSTIMVKIGTKNTSLIACILATLGSLIALVGGTNHAVQLAGRFLVGIGFGFYFICPAAVIKYWFSEKSAIFFQGVRTAFDYFSCSLPYYIMLPIFAVLGTWQKSFAFFAIPLVIITILYALFAKVNAEEKDDLAKMKAENRNLFAGVAEALKNKYEWCIISGELGKVFIVNMFGTYLPAFLEVERGLSPTTAAAVTGIANLSGIVGGVFWGALSVKTGRHKVFTWPSLLVVIVSAFGCLLTSNIVVLIVLEFLMGVGFTGTMIAYTSLPYELPGMSKAGAAAGGALGLCIPYLFSALGPVFWDLLEKAGLGMQGILLLFACVCVVFTIPQFFLPETGPKGKLARSSE